MVFLGPTGQLKLEGKLPPQLPDSQALCFPAAQSSAAINWQVTWSANRVLHGVTALNDNLQCLILRLSKDGKELCHLASNPPHVFPKWNIYECLKILLSYSGPSSFLFITELIEGQHSFHSFGFHGIQDQVMSQTQSTSATLSIAFQFLSVLFFL